jgi:type VI secretion system secreted protein VgrG
VVTGKSGEEIWPDKYGRVKVQFHWDREGKFDENSSCWIRVAQVWAGKQWGAIHIPRMGQEVIVEFLEGDPDRPIITGRVYNADQTVPYELPANKTQSGVKSRSSKDGTGDNYNEIRFEDNKGEEQLYIHAEKDQVIEVENDETTSVGHDRTEDVGNNEKITISGNRTESVGKDEKISIDGNRTESVGKDESITISGKRTEDVSKDESISIGGNRDETVGKKESVNIGDNREVQVSKNDELQVGKKYALGAGDEILLKTGSASILLKKDGTITIKGKDIRIEGSGAISLKASKDITLKGSKITQN